MKKQLPLGLVVEGNVTSSAVLRLPGMAQQLGPIKSTGLQVARRISNFLRAGYAVSEYTELQRADIVLLKLPDSSVARVVRDLCNAEMVFDNVSFVLCESWLPTETLEPLKAYGASIASLLSAPEGNDPCFVVEGQVSTVRQVRRVLERGGARTIELRPGSKRLFFAAKVLITAIPVPLLQTAQRALRDAGVSGNHLSSLLEEMVREMFGSFAKGARVAWGGPLNECAPETAATHLQRLSAEDPELSAALDELLTWARGRMERRV
jgi:predicted short-subunit dehydrogenase-like oxidoreductase (DUF2520 family)